MKKAQKNIKTTRNKKRQVLEAKTIKGAERALKEYSSVFKRLAEFDRARV